MGIDGMTEIDRAHLRDRLRAAMESIDGVDPLDKAPRDLRTERRRRRGLREPGGPSVFTLVDNDGVLSWEEGYGLRAPTGLRRGLRRSLVTKGEIVERAQVEPLELGNKITEYLAGLDTKWTPAHGLREWNQMGVQSPLPKSAPALTAGRALVFVHGTFSSSELLTAEILAERSGQAFMADAWKAYNKVYVFSHPTVSVSPVMNAVDLASHFNASRADVDLIAHSRGGLVARWWMEVLDRASAGRRRAALVGCPLDGTSLATPTRLRDALSWLANVNEALATVSTAGASLIPFLSVISGLLRVCASVTRVVARTPGVDAGVALVPGLSAMTRRNLELERLNVARASAPSYYAVTSDFEPQKVGLKVWKFMTEAKSRFADAAADLLFNESNDLVVDTTSMTHLSGICGSSSAVQIVPANVHDFGPSDTIHHMNYFRQAPLYTFIRQKLLSPSAAAPMSAPATTPTPATKNKSAAPRRRRGRVLSSGLTSRGPRKRQSRPRT